MAIIINIDVMLAKRKMSVTELSERVGITMANISVLKNSLRRARKPIMRPSSRAPRDGTREPATTPPLCAIPWA